MLPHLFTGGSGRDQRTSGMRCNAEAVFHSCIMKNKHFSSKSSPRCVTYLNGEFAKNVVFCLFFCLRLHEWEPDFCASKSVRREIPLLKNEGVCDPRIFAHRMILCTRGGIAQKTSFGPKKNGAHVEDFEIRACAFFCVSFRPYEIQKKRSKKGHGAHDNVVEDVWEPCARWGPNGGLRLQLEPTSQRPSQDDAR